MMYKSGYIHMHYSLHSSSSGGIEGIVFTDSAVNFIVV